MCRHTVPARTILPVPLTPVAVTSGPAGLRQSHGVSVGVLTIGVAAGTVIALMALIVVVLFACRRRVEKGALGRTEPTQATSAAIHTEVNATPATICTEVHDIGDMGTSSSAPYNSAGHYDAQESLDSPLGDDGVKQECLWLEHMAPRRASAALERARAANRRAPAIQTLSI